MHRAVVFFITLSLFVTSRVALVQCLAVNSSRTARSVIDSLEVVDFSRDRFVPRFYLNRPKNRYNHFQSDQYPENITIYEENHDRLYEAEPNTVRPLSWHDFPQLINDKISLADPNGYVEHFPTAPTPSYNESKPSLMANYSNIVPKFPIYFTNPSTGAVYAITEVTRPGHVTQNDSSGVFSGGSTYDERNAKYTLHCTMGDAMVNPTKKTLSNATRKKKKSRKNATKRKTTPITKHEDLPMVQVEDTALMKPKPKQNFTRLPTPIKFPPRPPATKSPTGSVFSVRRKITKRTLPSTAATHVAGASADKVKPKPNKEHNYYDDFNGFFFDESSYEDSTSDESTKTRKRIKRHQQHTPEKSRRNNKTKSLEEESRSSEEVIDYMNDMMSPIHDAFEILSKRAAGFLDKNEEKLEVNCSKPHYIMYGGGDGAADKSWFGSWFSSKEKLDSDKTETIAAKDPGWFDFFDDDNEEQDNVATEESSLESKVGSRWLFNWFTGNNASTNKGTVKKKATTTTTTTTQAPLTQEWLGILAQSFINNSYSPKSTPATQIDTETPIKMSYDGYQIWRLHLTDQDEVRTMEKYKHSGEGGKLQWLKGPSMRGSTDIIVPPKLSTDFQGTLNYEGIRHDILLFDLGKAITYDNASKTVTEVYKPKHKYPMTWTRYYRYEDIIRFLEYIQMKHPHIVDLIHVGRSYEGRPLIIAKISDKKRNKNSLRKGSKRQRKERANVKEIFIEAGSHGREWIGPAVATWIIKELIKTLRSNNTANASMKNSTWYILPVLNPDGYEYTHEYDRFWRKSRSKHISRPTGIINTAMAWLQQEKQEKLCFGVDLNRNWDYKWNIRGSSKAPCNEFYAGPSVFSEPETRAVSGFIKDNRKNLNMFISLHSYGQLISVPNNVSSPFGAQKVDDMMEVARVGLDGLRASGSVAKYRVNTGNEMIASRSGTSDYYAAYRAGVPFSYEIDLSDDGVHGFLLPGSFIEPTSRDAFEIIKSMVDYI